MKIMRKINGTVVDDDKKLANFSITNARAIEIISAAIDRANRI